MIKAIIFDWAEVISSHTFRDVVNHFANEVGIDPEVLQPVLLKNWKDFHEGNIEEKDFWIKVGGILNFTPPEKESPWMESLNAVYSVREGMIELIENLKKNYKVALLSNAEKNIVKMYEDMTEFKKLFDLAVFSCDVNVAKPDAKIYEITLEKLGVRPEESVFIDDRFDNVEGAAKVGINAIHFKSYEDLVENLTKLNVNTKLGTE